MQNEIRQDKIVGSRRFSNYFWSFFLFVGGLGFLLAGISSYFKVNLLPFADPTELVFIPQGIVMMFYGTLSLGFSIYIILTVLLDVGSGMGVNLKYISEKFPNIKLSGTDISFKSLELSKNYVSSQMLSMMKH